MTGDYIKRDGDCWRLFDKNGNGLVSGSTLRELVAKIEDSTDGFRMGLDAASELVAAGIDPRHDAERTAATELDEHGRISRATAEALLQVIHGLREQLAERTPCD